MILPNPESFVREAWLLWVISWFAAAVWSERPIKQAESHRQLGYHGLAVVGVVLLFFARRGAPIWRPAGGAAWGLELVVTAGLLFTWWARVTLGRLWSSRVERKADHRVVREGPYALVRHPIYTGIIFAAWATACLPATVTSLVGALLFTLAYVIKARLEERFLREQLGDAAYRDYAREVPMLVPFTRRHPVSRPR